MSGPLEDLIDILGAEVAIKLNKFTPKTTKRLTIDRGMLDIEYDDHQAVGVDWAFDGVHKPSKLVVLWDRPTPWKAGQRAYLRRVLLGAGVYDDEVTHLWASPYGPEVQPLDNHIAISHRLTMAALEAANTRYVLLCGAPSVAMWRPELKLKEVSGSAGVWDLKWVVYAIPNPVTVLREPMLQGKWRLWLYDFIDILNSPCDDGLPGLMAKCVMKDCTDDVLTYDPDGIGWCGRHWKKESQKAEMQKFKRKKKINLAQEERLDI